MARDALGLIETFGLIGAIEAADAAAKAAAVRLSKAEVTQAALVTVHIEGELGAVQAAVEAGVAACQRVGRLWSHVIIPRPDPGLDVMLDAPTNLYVPQGPFCAIVPSPPKSSSAPNQDGPSRSGRSSETRNRRPLTGGGDYASMTVQALRRLGRRRGDLPLAGRDIARADKETLIRLLTEADTRGRS
ncbi:MAG: BMC domain-containing protein [Candidatus Zixiibacteriota bacterium]